MHHFNFGPDSCDIQSVEKVINLFSFYWENSLKELNLKII